MHVIAGMFSYYPAILMAGLSFLMITEGGSNEKIYLFVFAVAVGLVQLWLVATRSAWLYDASECPWYDMVHIRKRKEWAYRVAFFFNALSLALLLSHIFDYGEPYAFESRMTAGILAVCSSMLAVYFVLKE